MKAGPTTRNYGGRPVVDRRSDRRQRFLAAGLTVFGETGYTSSTITALCQAAKLARAQFYENFDNREDLLIAVYDLVQNDARSAVKAATEQIASTDPVTRARVAVTAYAESVGADPRRARVSYVEVVGVSARVEQHRVDDRRIWSAFMESELRRAAGDTFIPPGGYPAATTGFIGALMALVHQWSVSDPHGDLTDVIEVLTRFLLSLLQH
ncbi:TetR/AcrR family transcriptional regulator [Nocardia brasiliensis]|uniref:TetR/AcrR family transcriptional regulator n=1 Tax=Nocardia brasiliensis TaxID=37326 RepID=UPI003D90A7BD